MTDTKPSVSTVSTADEIGDPIRPEATHAWVYVANLFALAGFFMHPLLHWWAQSSPSMERVMHGYILLALDADRAITLRFFLVWTGEIVALWLVGAGVALAARGIARRRERG